VSHSAEATRREDQELRARQREEKRAAREEERRQRLGYARGERECALAIERCIKHLEKAEKREGRNEGRAALRAQKEEAKKAKQDAKRERLESRVEGEVRRCVDKLIAKVERADARAKAQAEAKAAAEEAKVAEDRSAEWFYLCCDACEKWVHGRCVGVRPRDIDLLLEYVCVDCEAATGRKSHWLPRPEEKAKEEKAAAAAQARDAPKRAGVGGVYPKVKLKLATPDDDESRALVARYEAAYAALRPR